MITPIFNNLFNRNVNFGNSKVNMVCMNDMHGSLSFIDSFVSGRDEFYSQNKEGTNWTVSSGDMFIKGSENNHVVAKFIEKYVDVVAVGNHDVSNAKDLANMFKQTDIAHKFLSANMTVDKGSPLDGKIAKSIIVEDGDERIGFIGLSPMDFHKCVAKNSNNDFIQIKNLKDSMAAVKAEVEDLESKGIDKIVLLAHTGEQSAGRNPVNYYRAFASIGGIDVIIGGHDHLFVDEWAESSRVKSDNPNEFEPVRIFATGSSEKHYFAGNLNLFGTMNLTFDDNGVLIPEECVSEIKYTHFYPKTNFIDKYLSKDSKKVVGVLTSPLITTSDPLRNENVVANLVADSDFHYVKKHSKKGASPDFAFVNAGTVRDSFPDVELTKNKIQQVLPFKESLVKAELTKQQIYEALSVAAQSTSFKKATPGLMQVSHMTYTVNPDFSVSDVKILDDDGYVKFNLDFAEDDDKFVCVYDSFLASGPNLLSCLQAEPIEEFEVTRAEALVEYLSDVRPKPAYLDGRINMFN